MTEVVKTGDYFEHLTVPGDRWDLLAHDYYQDPDKADLIIEENRDLYLASLDPIPPILPSGITLRIPVIEQPLMDEQLLPPWKRNQS